MNGTMLKHGKTVGYIVLEKGGWSGGGVGTLCHGYQDARQRILLHGNPVTLFKSRRAAERAIRDSLTEGSERRAERFERY